MADPNLPQEINPVTFGNSLPPEVQQQILELQRRKQMAMMLQQQAMQPVQVQSHGPVASRVSPLAPLVQGLTGYLANRNASSADTDIAKIQGDYQTQTSNEIKSLLSLPPDQAINQGMSSRNPMVQQIAKTLMAQREGRLKEYINAAKETAPQLAMDAARTGQVTDARVPTPEAPAWGPGNQYLITKNVKGEQHAQFPPVAAANINLRLPGMEANTALDTLKTDLKTRQERAQLAKEGLQGTNGAIQALNEGAHAGGLEGVKQAVRKVAQGFGIQDAATAPTEKLSMALGQQVLSQARKLAPVTQNDITYLEKNLGSVSSDPGALKNMLTRVQQIHNRELQTYNRWVDAQSSNLQTPYAADLFRGAKIGYEIPEDQPTISPTQPMKYIRGKDGKLTPAQ